VPRHVPPASGNGKKGQGLKGKGGRKNPIPQGRKKMQNGKGKGKFLPP